MDEAKAYKILEKSLEKAKTQYVRGVSSNDRMSLEAIILGEHLTFRYILLTALLAKVVDPKIHTRSLQAQAKLYGAYDARSLCHHVVVPFERNELDLRLGGSNEPFLNKPARFVSVEKENPVRAGRDKKLLHILYDVLEEMNVADREIVESALVYCLFLTLKREPKLSAVLKLPSIDYTQEKAKKIISSMLDTCCGGESAVLVSGALLRLAFEDKMIQINPVNQAGSSSRGVGDIDIIENKKVICAIEVKDKPFTQFDVEHAMNVARSSDVYRLLFIIGATVNKDGIPPKSPLIKQAAEHGFDLSFVYIKILASTYLAMFDDRKRKAVIEQIPIIADEMRASDATRKHITSIFSDIDAE